MPPRHAYWTILIGEAPTAFRAREREELLPTFERLRAKQPDAVMRWFERGRLWASPEEARRPTDAPGGERRGRDWRPGGAHRDPRDRFKPKPKPQGREGSTRSKDEGRGPRDGGWKPRSQGDFRPKDEGRGPKDGGWKPKREGWKPKPPGERRPWSPKPPSRNDEGRDRKRRDDAPPRDDEPREERARKSGTRLLKKRRK